MSRQYLKELQLRAQRLLQASQGEEDDQEFLAHTATHRQASSPRGFGLPSHRDESDQQEEGRGMFESTDIELLKRCITLTNQNNLIRQKLSNQQALIMQLQQDVQASQYRQQQLYSQLETHRNTPDRTQPLTTPSPQPPSHTDKCLSRQRQQIRMQQAHLDKQYERLERGKAQFRALQKQKIQETGRQFRKQNQKQVKVSMHDQTVRQQMLSKELQERRQKYEEVVGRMRRLEGSLRRQRAKTTRLCDFINKQLPGLRDVMVQLTAKMDVKVERCLLKDTIF